MSARRIPWRNTQRPSQKAVAGAEEFVCRLRLPEAGGPISDQYLIDEAERITGVPMTFTFGDFNAEGRDYFSAYQFAQDGDPHRHILFDRRRAKNSVVRKGLYGHEWGHIWYGHSLRPLLDDAELIRQVPQLDPRLVTAIGTRCGGAADSPEQLQQEIDVEYFSGRLLDELLPLRLQPPNGMNLLVVESSLGGLGR